MMTIIDMLAGGLTDQLTWVVVESVQISGQIRVKLLFPGQMVHRNQTTTNDQGGRRSLATAPDDDGVQRECPAWLLVLLWCCWWSWWILNCSATKSHKTCRNKF